MVGVGTGKAWQGKGWEGKGRDGKGISDRKEREGKEGTGRDGTGRDWMFFLLIHSSYRYDTVIFYLTVQTNTPTYGCMDIATWE